MPRPMPLSMFPARNLNRCVLAPSGFTLTEMLTALTILIMVMLGVAVVFSNVSQALRQALGNSYAIRAKMDIARTLKTDIENINPNGLLAFVNMRALAFRDPVDRDTNGNAPFTGNVTGPGLAYDNVLGQNTANKGIGKRWYRCDLLTFCTSGYFPEQMGSSAANSTLYQNPGLASSDAWVTWGNAAVDTPQGAVNMCNNTFSIGDWRPNNLANDWCLGRRMVLLLGSIPAQSGVQGTMPVLSWTGKAIDLDQNQRFTLDVADFGLEKFPSKSTLPAAAAFLYRPRGMYRPSGIPPSRRDTALTTVMLAASVSDFCVEFAGDYLDQANVNNTSGWKAGQDGEVDYLFANRSGTGASMSLYSGDAPPKDFNIINTGVGQYGRGYSKLTIWYGLRSNPVDTDLKNLLWVPPVPNSIVQYAPTSPALIPAGGFPGNVMAIPSAAGTQDTTGMFGPRPNMATEALQYYLVAAFFRDNAGLWPRMLRISYRVHTGANGDDLGIQVQNIYHLPAAR